MQVRDDLGRLDRPQRRGAHRFVQAVLRLEQAGRVGEDELRVPTREQADHGETGGLRLGRDDRQVFADQGVQEGRLADVGAAGEDHRPALRHRPSSNGPGVATSSSGGSGRSVHVGRFRPRPEVPMTQRTLVVTSLLVGCAGRWASGQSPRPGVTRLGAADAYGPGITAVSAGGVEFLLERPAHVIVLRVGQDGSIEPIVPRAGEPTQYDVGVHSVEGPPLDEARVSPVREPVLRAARALAPGADLGDLVITPQAFKLTFPSVTAELEALPKALVAKRAGSWAAYYAGTK